MQLFADFVAAEGLFVHNGYCGQLYFLYAIGERCRLAVADFELRHGSLGGVGHHYVAREHSAMLGARGECHAAELQHLALEGANL